MSDVYVSDAVKYIGVNDKTIDLFESQYVVPNGVSYNSYVIMDEKIVPYYRSAPKPERDVEDRLSHIHDELKNGSTMIDGQIADDKAIDLIVTSAKVGIQLAKDHMKSEEE